MSFHLVLCLKDIMFFRVFWAFFGLVNLYQNNNCICLWQIIYIERYFFSTERRIRFFHVNHCNGVFFRKRIIFFGVDVNFKIELLKNLRTIHFPIWVMEFLCDITCAYQRFCNVIHNFVEILLWAFSSFLRMIYIG